MSGTTVATIETLTAEVRVLMVGSRQVTLSVARQLDWVHVDDLKPFGRVSLGGNYATNVLIGRSVVDGTLVLANYGDYRKTDDVKIDKLPSKIWLCRTLDATRAFWPYSKPLFISPEGDGRSVIVHSSLVDYCAKFHRDNREDSQCFPSHDFKGMESLMARECTRWRVNYEKFVMRESMPLIVLAGLR